MSDEKVYHKRIGVSSRENRVRDPVCDLIPKGFGGKILRLSGNKNLFKADIRLNFKILDDIIWFAKQYGEIDNKTHGR